MKKFVNLYPDVSLTTMSDQHVATYPLGTGRFMNDASTLVVGAGTSSNAVLVTLNANPNGGTWIKDVQNLGTTNFEPNPSDWFEQRYLVWRPMGCTVTVRVYCRVVDPDTGEEVLAAPSPTAYVTGFPYVLQRSGAGSPISQAAAIVSNYWDETATLGLTAENIPDLKYGWTRRVYGKGGSSVAKFKKSFSFAKMLGLTPAQYMSILPISNAQSGSAIPWYSVTCNPGSAFTDNPLTECKLAFAVSDDDPAATNRDYRYEVRMQQYGRWETTKLLYK